MWFGLCAEGSLCQTHYRKPESLPCSPHRLLSWSCAPEEVQSSYYRARKRRYSWRRPVSKTDHCGQTCTCYLFLFYWCFYTRLLYNPPTSSTTPPPSSCGGHIYSFCKALATMDQISRCDLDMTENELSIPHSCSHLIDEGFCVLCWDPVWSGGSLKKKSE